MGNIVLLDDLTINKIAAGEVIERPASVVKELVENSIDAGADNISIEIKNGGISYIRITDNGKGFLPDDMEIAFERHATSKIRQADDLETVTSMGFRGEALASIAAISHVELVSRTEENNIGSKIEVQGGRILGQEEAGCPKGTTITVTDLFYNTPVRYKFLKKDFTEAGYIEDAVTRIALVNPNIAIKLINSGKTIIQTSGNGDLKSVIYSIFGKDVAENIIDVDYQYEDMKVTGVIGKPVIARSNRTNQLFFVNKRYIKDKILTSAIEQGYKGMLTIGKYAFAVLNIEMNPKKVDVNVHPAKLEVRFEEENIVFKAVYHTVKEGLLKGDLVPDRTRIELNQEENKLKQAAWKMPTEVASSIVSKDVNNVVDLDSSATEAQAEEVEKEEPIEEKKFGFLDKFTKFKEELLEKKNEEKDEEIVENSTNLIEQIYQNRNEDVKEDTAKIDISNVTNMEDTTKVEIPVIEIVDDMSQTKVLDLKEINEKIDKLNDLKVEPDYTDFNEMYARTFGTTVRENKLEEEKDEYKLNQNELKTVENVSLFEKEEVKDTVKYKFIGIAFSTYIIIEMNSELYIIDQHAAHELVLYEKTLRGMKTREFTSQYISPPIILNLSMQEEEILNSNLDKFATIGFEIESFGGSSYAVRAVPDNLFSIAKKELLIEMLDNLADGISSSNAPDLIAEKVASMSCKAAVKGNARLSTREVETLIGELLNLENPYHCPHGRPTIISMTKRELEKKFKRIV